MSSIEKEYFRKFDDVFYMYLKSKILMREFVQYKY